jgi:uncharacterized protein (TIGR00290 family)
MKEKVLFSWSGGKDSTLALYELQKIKSYDIAALLTTVTQEYDRISMHGVRTTLLDMQVESLGLPLEKILIGKDTTDEQYEHKMRQVLEKYLAAGITSVVFGDISLEDIREYRENNLRKMGIKSIFPIWKMNAEALAHNFIDSGFKAVVTCIDTQHLDKKFAGMTFDKKFLLKLPPSVDLCGENGEFHSFVYDGPIFKYRIPHIKRKIVLKENRYYFCDLLPLQDSQITGGKNLTDRIN